MRSAGAAGAAAVASPATDMLAQDIARVFGADGALAQSVDGFVPRASQLAMAQAIHRAMADGDTLVAEAGTGTGKTFAYLVPALLAGGKVLISTGTKPLQDQLYRKDLPAVLRALKINAATAILKGRANYLCLQRMARAESEALLSSRDDARHLRAIVRFSKLTASGDRSELDEVPENAAVWPWVTSTRENCLGTECPRFAECFVFKARRDAQEADVVVVNHHLFLADLAMRDDAVRDFLPAVDTVVLDEAHQVPEVAADFFGTTLSLGQWMDVARDSRSLGLSRAADGASWTALTGALDKAARDVRLTLADIGLAPGSRTPLARLPARGSDSRLAQTLQRLDEQADGLERALKVNSGRDAELDLLPPRIAELRRALADWTAALQLPRDEAIDEVTPADDGDGDGPAVRWVSVSAHGAQFNRTPLAPGRLLARARENQSQPWILTSATLTTGGRFDAFLADLGIAARTARWESPFDFARQARLYLPQRMPSPYDARFSEQVAEAAWPLVQSNGGRAFVLCTTLRAVDALRRACSS